MSFRFALSAGGGFLLSWGFAGTATSFLVLLGWIPFFHVIDNVGFWRAVGFGWTMGLFFYGSVLHHVTLPGGFQLMMILALLPVLWAGLAGVFWYLWSELGRGAFLGFPIIWAMFELMVLKLHIAPLGTLSWEPFFHMVSELGVSLSNLVFYTSAWVMGVNVCGYLVLNARSLAPRLVYVAILVVVLLTPRIAIWANSPSENQNMEPVPEGTIVWVEKYQNRLESDG